MEFELRTRSPWIAFFWKSIHFLSQKVKSFFPSSPYTKTYQFYSEQPSRLFLLPDQSQLEKIYFILSSLNYEVIEQSVEEQGFHLVAQLDQPPRSNFQSIWLSVNGSMKSNRKWEIRVFFHTNEYLSDLRARDADLILEQIALALGWRDYQIIECSSPKALAA